MMRVNKCSKGDDDNPEFVVGEWVWEEKLAVTINVKKKHGRI